MTPHRSRAPLAALLAALLGTAALLPAHRAEAGTSSISGDNYPFQTLTDMMPVDLGWAYQTMVEDARMQIAAGGARHVEMDVDDALDNIEAKLGEAADKAASWLDGRGIDDDAGKIVEAAVAAAATGNPITALALYRLALEEASDAETPGILVNMAGLCNMLGLPSEALALLEEAEDQFDGKQSAALLANRGHALILVRRYAEAEVPLRKALQITPYLMEATRNLAIALALQGKEEQGRKLMPAAVWRRSVNETFDYVAHGVEGDPFSEDEPVAIEVMEPGDVIDLSRGVRGRLPKLTIPGNHRQLATFEREIEGAAEATMAAQMSHMAKLPELLQATADRPGDYSNGLVRYLHDYVTGRLLTRLTIDSGTFGSGEGEAGGPIEPDWTYYEHELKRIPKDLRGLQKDLAVAEIKLNKAIEENMRLVEQLDPPADGERADANGCFPTDRRNADRLLNHIAPPLVVWDGALVALHSRAHLDATGIAANIGDEAWHRLLDADINRWSAEVHGLRVMTAGTALSMAVGVGARCSLPEGLPEPLEEKESPFCTEERQQYSLKKSFGPVSVEATCGKAKVVIEQDVMMKMFGVHAEIELTAKGEVTVFAGPKLTAAAIDLGPLSADFGVKDGLYITAGPQGVKEFGMRTVVGGGVSAGAYGVTHDVGQVDIPLDITTADIVSAFSSPSAVGNVDGPATEAALMGR